MLRSRTREEISAGGVVYRLVDGVPHFLLIRDSYHNWGFPKGHLKKEESPDRAAMREVREETGLSELRFAGEAGTIDWNFRFKGTRIHKVCHFFVMESARGETVPQTKEGITECIWLSGEEALERLSYENAREVLRSAVRLLGPGARGHGARGQAEPPTAGAEESNPA